MPKGCLCFKNWKGSKKVQAELPLVWAVPRPPRVPWIAVLPLDKPVVVVKKLWINSKVQMTEIEILEETPQDRMT